MAKKTKATQKSGSDRKSKKSRNSTSIKDRAESQALGEAPESMPAPTVPRHIIERHEQRLNLSSRREKYVRDLFGGKPSLFDARFRHLEGSKRSTNLRNDIVRAHEAARKEITPSD